MSTSPFATGLFATEGRKAVLPHFSIPAEGPPAPRRSRSAIATSGNSPSSSSTSPSLSYSSSSTSPSATTVSTDFPLTPSGHVAGGLSSSASPSAPNPPSAVFDSSFITRDEMLSLGLGDLLKEDEEGTEAAAATKRKEGGKVETVDMSFLFGGSSVELRPPTLPPLQSPKTAVQSSTQTFFPPSYSPVASSSSFSPPPSSATLPYPPSFSTYLPPIPSFTSTSFPLSPAQHHYGHPPAFLPLPPLSIGGSVAPGATYAPSPSSLALPIPLPSSDQLQTTSHERRRSPSSRRRTEALRSPSSRVLGLGEFAVGMAAVPLPAGGQDGGEEGSSESRKRKRKTSTSPSNSSSFAALVGGGGGEVPPPAGATTTTTTTQQGEKEKSWLDRLREAEVRAKLYKRLEEVQVQGQGLAGVARGNL
ncbi:hypothetical protein JCM11251_002481 [Rhodosporidiobolus azoricus]